MNGDRAVRSAAITFIVGAVFFVLAWAKSLLIPLAVAVVVSYLLEALAEELKRAVPRAQRLPRWFFLAFSVVLSLLGGIAMVNALTLSLSSVTEAAPHYQENLMALAARLAAGFGMKEAPSLGQLLADLDFKALIGSLAGSLASVAGDLGLIIVYVIFMMVEKESFEQKLFVLLPQGEGREQTSMVLAKIHDKIRKYVLIKTFASVVVGLLSYAVLFFVGVDYPFFWSFLIFLLNFIPTVGALAGVALPALLTLVQFAALGPFLTVLIGLVAIQFATGNFLEPRMLGASLNISPLVVIISLALWGKLWGVTGMFLCVPLTVIMMIVFAHFEKTRPIAVLLSQDGRVAQEG